MLPTVPSHDYKDLLAWQKAMDLAEAVYTATSYMPREERFELVRQARRAAVSIPANIAEGQGRKTSAQFFQFLAIAHGSLRELETHLMLAERLRLLPKMETDKVLASAAEVGRLINGLSRSLHVR